MLCKQVLASEFHLRFFTYVYEFKSLWYIKLFPADFFWFLIQVVSLNIHIHLTRYVVFYQPFCYFIPWLFVTRKKKTTFYRYKVGHVICLFCMRSRIHFWRIFKCHWTKLEWLVELVVKEMYRKMFTDTPCT